MDAWGNWLAGTLGLVLIGTAHLVLRRIIQRAFRGRHSQTLVRSLLNWVTLLVLLFVTLQRFAEIPWLFDPLVHIGSAPISLFLLIVAVFIVILAVRISSLAKVYLLPGIYEKYQLDPEMRFTFNGVFQYTVILVAVLVALGALGINFSSLTVLAGVIGVGIGFGMQNIASNFISGIIILFERPIKTGDRVLIGDIIGDVSEIRMRATIIRTLDNQRTIIPNSFFLEEKVINRTHSDTRLRVMVPVGVSYDSDVRQVETQLLAAATAVREQRPTILTDPAPFVRFVDFGDSSLDFVLFVWIENQAEEWQIQSDLRFTIFQKFREHGIQIPFPQRDLHLRSGFAKETDSSTA